jgi:hypothetical protein
MTGRNRKIKIKQDERGKAKETDTEEDSILVCTVFLDKHVLR